jgi:cellulose biosynthesis protein BcsQ
MIKTIAFINQKGWTGKTTSASNIGAGLRGYLKVEGGA